MKTVYLGLAMAGAVIPYLFFLDFFVTEGVAVQTFAGALFINGAAGGFVADVLISSVVFWICLFHAGEKRAWIYILINLTIGLSCALPCYLYFREKRLSNATATVSSSQ